MPGFTVELRKDICVREADSVFTQLSTPPPDLIMVDGGWFLEGTLEHDELLDVLILCDQQLVETKTFCKCQHQAIPIDNECYVSSLVIHPTLQEQPLAQWCAYSQGNPERVERGESRCVGPTLVQ